MLRRFLTRNFLMISATQVPEVTQSEEGQRSKLRVVLGFANHVLGLRKSGQQPKW